MANQFDYDLFVIGAGSGGVRAARMSASMGARVGIAEDRYYGGTCVNVGCVPKKLFVYASHVREDVADAAGFGWSGEPPRFDWPTLLENKNREIARLNGIYDSLLKNAGVEIHWGRAVLIDPQTVEVGDQRFSAEKILVATGSWPVKPDIPGAELAITSNEAFFLDALPKKALIVGGGYIAVEFAGIWHGLDVDVTLAYRGPHILRGFDDDIRFHVAEQMRGKGVDIRCLSNATAIDRDADGLQVTFNDDTVERFDAVMFATGRRPNTAGLGLDEIGVELDDNGAIMVNDGGFQSSVPSIWALGDVIDRFQLTPVAIAEAMALTRHWWQGGPLDMDYEGIPTAVFSQPPIGTVGLTEAQARDRYGEVDVYMTSFRALKNTLSGNPERTLMKLIVEKVSDRVAGAHMAGPDAGEIVQGLAVALKAGATKAQFDATVGIHPTSAEEFVTMRDPIDRPEPERAAAE